MEWLQPRSSPLVGLAPTRRVGPTGPQALVTVRLAGSVCLGLSAAYCCGAECGAWPERLIAKPKTARLQNRGLQVRVLPPLLLTASRKSAWLTGFLRTRELCSRAAED